jgi:thiol-disulfide isomerase/thioredoxin
VSGRVAALVAVLTALGCSSSRAVQTAAPQLSTNKSESPPLLYQPTPIAATVNLDELRFVGMDDGPVPDFRLRLVGGKVVESEELVGERAFVVVFFATWCQACDKKLDVLAEVLKREDALTTLAVALDDAPTWHRVPPTLRRHGLSVPVAAAVENPEFFLAYNPFDTVPLVVVVGQNGGLVDYQLGVEDDDEERLASSLDLAQRIGPLAPHRPN